MAWLRFGAVHVSSCGLNRSVVANAVKFTLFVLLTRARVVHLSLHHTAVQVLRLLL